MSTYVTGEADEAQGFHYIDLHRNIYPDVYDGKPMHVISEDFGEPVYLIHRFVKAVEKGSHAYTRDSRGQLKPRALAKYFKFADRFLSLYRMANQYTPYVEAFFSVFVVQHGLIKGDFGNDPERWIAPGMRAGELFESLIGELRTELESSKFKGKLADRKETFAAGYAKAMQYVDALFRWHSRLLVVRIDLEFRKAGAPGMYFVSLDRARAYFRLFLRRMRHKALYRKLVGFIWRLEYGEGRGYHYHVFLFFDGRCHKKHEYISLMVKRDWEAVCEPVGYAFACNLKFKKYPIQAIGEINHWETQLVSNLKTILRYTFEHEKQLVHDKPGGKIKTWGMGAMPGTRRVRRGRPRHRLPE